MAKKLQKSDAFSPVFNRIIDLCESNNTTVTALLDKFTNSRSTMNAWKNGNIGTELLPDLANELNVSLDVLLTGKEKINKNQLPKEEQEFFEIFNNLSDINKGKVMERAKTLAEIEAEEKAIEMHTNPGYIESYTLPASAGTGVDLDSCEKMILEVKDASLINGANFAIRISGNSMEPEFHDGEYALVRTQPQIEQGKIGIFTVNSDGYIKKLGAGELISLNPEYDDIQLHEYDEVRCRGEVIGTIDPDDVLDIEEF